jgi:high-affinity nickel-transport protein
MDFSASAPAGIALLGLLMGMRHATDPDHVIAVATIVSRERRILTASRIGVMWGLGHTITVLVIGALIILFKIAIPARLGLAMEFAVAIILILLGLGATARLVQRLVLRLMRRPSDVYVHSHTHSHGEHSHWHPHVHQGLEEHGSDTTSAAHYADGAPRAASLEKSIKRPILRAFGVGLVHGLAGSAAIALLVLSAIPEPLWASIYLGIFCIGTIIGMALITMVIAAPITIAAGRLAWMHQGLVMGSGLLSFGFGLFLTYQLGVVDHLFGGAPRWTPE